MSNKVIIYRRHDRHVEDVVEVFEYTPEAYEKLKKRCRKDWCLKSKFPSTAPGKRGHWCCEITDYEWGWEDSYWSSLTIKELKCL